MTKPTTRKASAQRLDGAFSFDLTATAAAVAEQAFKTVPVLPPQGAVGRDGRGPFTYDVAVVAANVRANGADIPVFLDHEPGVARGWIDHTASPVAMPDGSYEWPVEYTAEGLALLTSKAYRYNSPTWLFIQDPAITDRQAGRIVGVLEVSLTNLPNQFLRSLNSAEQGSAYTVDIPVTSKDEMTAEQLAALGLAEDASSEAILAAINALKLSANAQGFKVGDTVKVKSSRAHDKMTAVAVGEVVEVSTPALAVKFDGMEKPHRWYVASELEAADPSEKGKKHASMTAETDVELTDEQVQATSNRLIASGAVVTKQAYDEAVTAKQAAEAALVTAEQARATAEQALAAYKSEQAEQSAVAAVDAAIAAGKYTPAARDGLLKQARADLATFAAVSAALPAHPAASSNAVATRTVESGPALPASTLEMMNKLRIDPKFAQTA